MKGTALLLAGGLRVWRLVDAMPGVDLWWTPVGDMCGGWLSGEERERMARLRFEADRRAFLTKRVLVRGVLSAYGGVAPVCWRFRADEFGKPRVEGFGPEFSVARSGEMAVCAVSRGGSVGVDVEDAQSPAAEELPEWVLAPGEREALRGLAGEARRRVFLGCWTLKEAFVKGLGSGLSLPVERVGFAETEEGIAVEVPGEWGLGAGWRFGRACIAGRYVVAMAAGPLGGSAV